MVDAREYHERTKHSPEKLRSDTFELDYENQPRPYKTYVDLPGEALDAIEAPRTPALSAIAESGADPLAGTEQDPPAAPDRVDLGTLCYLASGIIETVQARRGEMAFRAASCTGKLYHVDCYLVCGDLPDIGAGVYHFDPRSFELDVLREGDFRSVLAAAAGGYPAVVEAPVTVVTTSTWWRNAWKYRNRTYRHAFWDSGTVLANLLAAAHALDHRGEVVTGFADDPVAALLGIDPEREAPLQLVPIGQGHSSGAEIAVEPLDPATEPLSEHVVEYPLVIEAWEQSRLADGEGAATWRERVRAAGSVGRRDPGDGDRYPLDPVDRETASARPLYATIRRRGSCREYADDALSRRKLGTVLDRATRGVPSDWNGGAAGGLQYNDCYVLLTDVEGVPDGSYQFHPPDGTLERLGGVDQRTKTHLALDQRWAGEANANVYLLSDVDEIVDRLGDRGYRLAQLEAGIVLGKLYLATYAHRDLGGTGLTFFDDIVTEHLAPRASGQTPTTLFAFGPRGDS